MCPKRRSERSRNTNAERETEFPYLDLIPSNCEMLDMTTHKGPGTRSSFEMLKEWKFQPSSFWSIFGFAFLSGMRGEVMSDAEGGQWSGTGGGLQQSTPKLSDCPAWI